MSEESISALIEAFEKYKINKDLAAKSLCFQLDQFSKSLAKDEAFRVQLVLAFPALWSHTSDIWDVLISSDWSEGTISRRLMLSLSRFIRNLVAGAPTNQEHAFLDEPKIRRILHQLTSYSLLEDSDSYPITRMLVQTISNVVTLNNDLTTRLWTLYTTLPEDQNVLIRLLASPDTGSVVATLVLIMNCVKDKFERMTRLISPIGLRITVLLLDRTEGWVDADEESNEAFTIAYRVFEAFLKEGLGDTLYRSLSIDDEPITPHQITLLKIIDSTLRSEDGFFAAAALRRDGYSFLSTLVRDFCSYSQHAIRRSLGIEPSLAPNALHKSLKELDLRLPKVSAALILVSQCLITICLKEQEIHDSRMQETPSAGLQRVITATQAEGFVETLIETLRLVDHFLPRIVFGQAVPIRRETPDSHPRQIDTTGFAYLKRDLVRLLGTICHERKNIQDRIRECDGIPVVMGLCVIDERNPYLQEHGLFALRNILHRNPENQSVVEAMKMERR